MTGETVDVRAVTDDAAAAESGVRHAGVLLAFADALVGDDHDRLPRMLCRKSCVGACGSPAHLPERLTAGCPMVRTGLAEFPEPLRIQLCAGEALEFAERPLNQLLVQTPSPNTPATVAAVVAARPRGLL